MCGVLRAAHACVAPSAPAIAERVNIGSAAAKNQTLSSKEFYAHLPRTTLSKRNFLRWFTS